MVPVGRSNRPPLCCRRASRMAYPYAAPFCTVARSRPSRWPLSTSDFMSSNPTLVGVFGLLCPLASQPTHSLGESVSEIAIEVRGLRKAYGQVLALAGIDLDVPAGTALGLLGPNGAGKTTAVRILATLLRPDAGTARVTGFDVVRQAARVREQIGLTGQYAAVDGFATGRENLIQAGMLHHVGRRRARTRAAELLELFDLTEVADRRADTYSGGLRRRLDVAASLVGNPPVLFFDEPTTGLDPRARSAMWKQTERLVADGTTVLLSTQYLDEADRLAQRIAVLERGRIVAEGTPDELKAGLGGDRLRLRPAEPADGVRLRSAVGGL